MAIKIQNRRGTTVEWETANPVLAAGEIGFDTTNKWFKIGNGTTAWNSLPYFLDIDSIDNQIDLAAQSPLQVDASPTGPGLTISLDSSTFVKTNAVNTITAPSSTSIPLIIKGAASQTAKLQRWSDNSNTEIASIDASGNFVANGDITATTGDITATAGGISGTSVTTPLINPTGSDITIGASIGPSGTDIVLDGNSLDINSTTVTLDSTTATIGSAGSSTVSVVGTTTTIDGTTTNIGTTTATAVNVGKTGGTTAINGTTTVSGATTFASKFGYGETSNTVSQATSKAQGVTLNKLSGTITLNGAALAAATVVSFTLTNSQIAAGDIIVFSHVATGTLGGYNFTAVPGNGSAVVYVRNNTAGSLSEAIQVRFVVIKTS